MTLLKQDPSAQRPCAKTMLGLPGMGSPPGRNGSVSASGSKGRTLRLVGRAFSTRSIRLSEDFAGPRYPRRFVLGEPPAQLTNLIHRDLVVLKSGFPQRERAQKDWSSIIG